MPGKDGRIAADRGASANASGKQSPVRLRLHESFDGRRPRVAIVGEHHAVSDKDLVGDLHPFANKAVGRYFAAFANDGIFLNFDKRPDFRLVADAAPVKIYQIFVIQDDIRSENDIR